MLLKKIYQLWQDFMGKQTFQNFDVGIAVLDGGRCSRTWKVAICVEIEHGRANMLGQDVQLPCITLEPLFGWIDDTKQNTCNLHQLGFFF